MQVTFTPHPQHLKVIIRRRESIEESRAAAASIAEALQEHRLKRLLVVIEETDPIFRVEQYGLGGWLERMAVLGLEKAALVSDSAELFASHQYVELLATQRGMALKAFRKEKEALGWLLD